MAGWYMVSTNHKSKSANYNYRLTFKKALEISLPLKAAMKDTKQFQTAILASTQSEETEKPYLI